MSRLEGKVALITGAGGGIGRESAILFAREGAKIVVVDVTEKTGKQTVKLVRAAGGEAVFAAADVSRADDCERMVRMAEKKFGRLDILFNNAGIMHHSDDNAVTTEESIWDLTMNINARGVFLGCKYGFRRCGERGADRSSTRRLLLPDGGSDAPGGLQLRARGRCWR
jgi:NAD(P)-dependent dehydrogenase (short-subunit alcohol dehydrogenase family)